MAKNTGAGFRRGAVRDRTRPSTHDCTRGSRAFPLPGGVATRRVDARMRCAVCGHTCAENRKNQAVSSCRACGHEANADVNAAINILAAGLAVTARGGTSRSKGPSEARTQPVAACEAGNPGLLGQGRILPGHGVGQARPRAIVHEGSATLNGACPASRSPYSRPVRVLVPSRTARAF